MVAAFVRSGFRVPQSITEVLSLYLLWAIGFRGGVELRAGAFGREEILGLLPAVFLAAAIPGSFVPMALALTFPLNLAVGIPIHAWLVRLLS